MSIPRLERLPELDALRGLFLVWMTLVHMPTQVSSLVNSPFGYFSSASGFVFISALLGTGDAFNSALFSFAELTTAGG